MWITQTYLGEVEPNADVFVYYFFEDYVQSQRRLTQRIQSELEDLGTLFGSKVSLLMPNPRYAIQIESELRDKFQSLWWDMAGKLPGLFVCTAPLPKLDPRSDQGHLFSVANASVKQVAELVQRIRDICDEQIRSKAKDTSVASVKRWTFRRFVDAVELKPGIAGIRIDLRKLIRLT